MRIMVPEDHGATDVLEEGPGTAVLRPHRYGADKSRTTPHLVAYGLQQIEKALPVSLP